MNEYTFDASVIATFRVKADSEDEAVQLMYEKLYCGRANFGIWPDGTPILSEVTIDEHALVGFNGEAV